MVKVILLLGLIVAVFIAESSSQLVVRPTFRPPRGGIVIIRPTYRPPRTRRPIIRYAREAGNEEPQWLYKDDNIPRAPTSGDHPILPSIIDDVKIDPNRRYARSAGNEVPQWLFKGDDIPKAPASGDHPVVPSIIDDIKLDANRRHVRSVDSPSAKRGGGSHSISSSSRNTGPTHPGHNRRNSRSVDSPSARRHGGHSTSSGTRDTGEDTGATHPGYNRRNTREIRLPTIYDPFRPSPTIPKPLDPFNPRPGLPRRPFPIYARVTRDLHIPGVKKPTHRDVIIPNWNPNARVNPWQRIGVKSRNTRSVDISNNEEKRGFLEDLDTDFV